MSAYEAGNRLEVELLETCTGRNAKVNFEIRHAYTPFTMSVVLQARLLNATSVLPSGSVVILKILDRRYIDEEDRQRNKEGWTEYREHLARERWQAIADGTRENDFDEQAELEDWPEDWIEEDYHRRSAEWFQQEAEAYRRLAPLQGKTIPRLYHTFRIRDNGAPGQTIPLDDVHMPHGFAFEYLENALTAADIPDPSSLPLLRKHTRDIMSTMSSLHEYGVIHGDVRSENLLCGPDRAAVIDFGYAMFRLDSQNDDEWKEAVRLEDNIGAARHILHLRNLRPESPLSAYHQSPDDCRHENRFIHRHTDEWIDRWYHCLIDREAREELRKAGYKRGEAPWFRKKDEVEQWQAARQPNYEGFQQPRPGSPDWQTRAATDEVKAAVVGKND